MYLLFNPVFRLSVFWVIVVGVVAAASHWLSWVDPPLVAARIQSAIQAGELDGISEKSFAFSLASIIFLVAAGMIVSFGLCHVVPAVFALQKARLRLTKDAPSKANRAQARGAFATNFEIVRETLESNRLIGYAWAEFEETLYDTDSETAIGNTVRPQAFFNPSIARERLGGLKMMNAVPGYFVGIGLLLTFIGLVIALYKAGAAANAGSAEQMVDEMGSLLQIATFKFSTSIAGLGASILLSIVFRWYSILIEAAFDRFNATLERNLLYAAPQSISLEMKRTMQDQLVQLKDITQGQFFNRMGEEIAPRLNSAISQAMQPVTEQIGTAVGNLTANSRDGVDALLQRFSESVNHGAGTELRELAATLKQLQMSMVETQGSLSGSGDDFSRKLSDAADNLNRMVEQAGASFEKSSGESRDALTGVVEALRLTLDKANSEMDAALGGAAKGASDKLESAMGAVLEKLEAQIGQFGAHSEQTRAQLSESVSVSADMQKAVLGGLESTVSTISEQLRGAVEAAVASVEQRFSDLSTSMRSIEDALRGQKVALEGASLQASRTADAFGQSARSVERATAPLTSVGAQFSSASEHLAASVADTMATMKEAREGISALAAGLSETNQETGVFWESFRAKFDDVDTALGQSVSVLSQSTLDQQQRLQEHVRAVDSAMAEAVGKLASTLTDIQESAGSIADSLETWKNR